jgi:small GTP-binding protein
MSGLNIEEIDLSLKLIIVGDSSVGKTNILTRYTKNVFSDDSKATIGVEFGTKILDLNDHKIKLQIWDTAGQERYKAVTVAYYKGSKGAFVVYDVTNKSTFHSLENWINDIRKNGDKETCIILIGNKTDLQNREVTYDQGKKFAEIHSKNL